MKHFAFLLILTVLLGGCTRKTPVETITDNAMAQVVALEKTLPNECKTDGVLAQLVSIRAEIASAPQACELQIKPIRQQRNGYAIALFALIALTCIFIFSATSIACSPTDPVEPSMAMFFCVYSAIACSVK